MAYLQWEVQRRANTRSKSFAKKDMVRRLRSVGCEVSDHSLIFLLDVRHPLPDDYTIEDAKSIRTKVTQSIRTVHPQATKIFKGIIE